MHASNHRERKQHGLKAAKLQQTSTRNDVALAVRRQFYTVVEAIHLARVNTQALRLARDDERRVRALFEVGSVSRSDLLRAQVRTASSQLDSITARVDVVNQRIGLAEILAMPEGQLGEVDTALTAESREFDEGAVLEEAAKRRPDIQAAEAELRSAKAGLTAARLARLPYVTVSGSASFDTKASVSTTGPTLTSNRSRTSPTSSRRAGSRTSLRRVRSFGARSTSHWIS